MLLSAIGRKEVKYSHFRDEGTEHFSNVPKTTEPATTNAGGLSSCMAA